MPERAPWPPPEMPFHQVSYHLYATHLGSVSLSFTLQRPSNAPLTASTDSPRIPASEVTLHCSALRSVPSSQPPPSIHINRCQNFPLICHVLVSARTVPRMDLREDHPNPARDSLGPFMEVPPCSGRRVTPLLGKTLIRCCLVARSPFCGFRAQNSTSRASPPPLHSFVIGVNRISGSQSTLFIGRRRPGQVL